MSIALTISQGVDQFNVHNELNVDEHDLLDPIVEEYSNYDSFEDLAEAVGLDDDYDGISLDEFDGFIRREIIHPQIGCLHSLLTFAMNHFSTE